MNFHVNNPTITPNEDSTKKESNVGLYERISTFSSNQTLENVELNNSKENTNE